MLDTDIKHVETNEEIKDLLRNNTNVVVCCGRMGPMCIPVYNIIKKLEPEYSHVQMRDMDFDIAAASFIKNLPECTSFMGLPFTVYFRKGEVVGATSSIQNERQVRCVLDEVFKETEETKGV